MNVSIFTLAVISIERYRALLHPFESRITKSAAGYCIAVIWITAFTCASPMMAALRVELVDDPQSHSGLKEFCCPSGLSTPLNDSKRAKEDALYESSRIFGGYVIFLVVIQFLAPLIVIGYAYINIAVHLWGSHMHTFGDGRNDLNAVRTKQRQKVNIASVHSTSTPGRQVL